MAVSVLTAMTLMQEKFCFGRVRVSVFVRVAFTRLGSAPLGSVRAKDKAEIICIRRYVTAVYYEMVPNTVAQSLKRAGAT